MRLLMNSIGLAAMLLVPGRSDGQVKNHINTNTKNKEVVMAIQNKEVVRKLYEESLNKRNLELLHDFVSDEYVGPGGARGVSAFEEPVTAVIKGFPDIQWQIEALIADGDQVVVKWKIHGTHTGRFQQLSPTGKTVSNDGIGIYTLKDGKVVRTQVHTDRLSFLQQLNVLPTDLTLLSKKNTTKKDQVSFIDKFFVPAAARTAFLERMRINRDFIATLPGFIEDAAYVHTNDHGDLICVTVALWENEEALAKAKEAVQAEYKKQGFDMAEMVKRLNVVVDRGVYTELEEY